MGNYCDSATIEYNWFCWLVARSVPVLNLYRESGLLYTRVTGIVPDSKIRKPDPEHPVKQHCILADIPVYFSSVNGQIAEDVILPLELPPGPFARLDEHEPPKDYFQDKPAEESWKLLLADIYKICNGISRKFTLDSDEARSDLASEAVSVIARKLNEDKLKYKPGKAPVFNLLTTAIYRSMCSILTRETRKRQNYNKLVCGITNGSIKISSLDYVRSQSNI